ncbi:MAG: hypothetical protein FD125_786 [bacterium]|nr:MAG: hypothetical protein FD125_786 [bacterium]
MSRTTTTGPPSPTQNQGLMATGLISQFPNCQTIQAPTATYSRRLNIVDGLEFLTILAALSFSRMYADASIRLGSKAEAGVAAASGHCRHGPGLEPGVFRANLMHSPVMLPRLREACRGVGCPHRVGSGLQVQDGQLAIGLHASTTLRLRLRMVPLPTAWAGDVAANPPAPPQTPHRSSACRPTAVRRPSCARPASPFPSRRRARPGRAR